MPRSRRRGAPLLFAAALVLRAHALVPTPAERAAVDRRALLGAACSAALPWHPRAARASDDVEAKSPLIAVFKNFLPSDAPPPTTAAPSGALDAIDWAAPKRRGLTNEQMADAIGAGLREDEWFVTGRGRPQYFSEKFLFSDPQVKLEGFEAYCRGVRRLFDQGSARCEVVCCAATAPDTLTVVWRNSGRVNLGPLGVELKPYVVTSTLALDPRDGLVVSQVDTFDADTAGLLLYQVPLLRPLTKPAPGVDALRGACDLKTCKLTA